jgi:hypothetical protein
MKTKLLLAFGLVALVSVLTVGVAFGRYAAMDPQFNVNGHVLNVLYDAYAPGSVTVYAPRGTSVSVLDDFGSDVHIVYRGGGHKLEIEVIAPDAPEGHYRTTVSAFYSDQPHEVESKDGWSGRPIKVKIDLPR